MKKKLAVRLMLFLTVLIISLGTGNVFATTASITGVTQTPWIIDDAGNLKSETNLSITSDSTYNAWVKITVSGKTAYMESIGTLTGGSNTKTVHVLELNNDGDNVTFQVYNNSGGTGTALASTTVSQKKIRHWTLYVAHDHHVDIGYTDYQEYLLNTKWPSHLDAALGYINDTNSWSDNDKFRFPMEQSVLLYGGALKVRDADYLQNVRTQLANNRLTYAAGYMNMDMGAMSTEELARFYYYSGRFVKDQLGVGSSGVLNIIDVPDLSWAAVDIMADIGVKYVLMASNPESSMWSIDHYPRIFYLQGRNPSNKVMVNNHPLYNLDEFHFCPDGPYHTPEALATTVASVNDKLINAYHTGNYPYNAVLELVTQYWDNGPLLPEVKDRIKEMNARTDALGRPYVYPKFVNSTVKDFFQQIDTNFSAIIPTYKGNIESWWNYGEGSSAYDAAIARTAHDKVPAAEMFATLANVAAPNTKYPYSKIADAFNYLNFFDEHTFSPSDCSIGDQFIWKRNSAIASNTIAENLLNDSLTSINSLIPTTDKTITVYNPLSWNRTDLVTVKQSDLPAHFDLTDVDTSTTVKYQKLGDGSVQFVAANVPGIGYKCFRVTSRADDPVFTSNITTTANTLENNYFKVTFDNNGSVTSILDKSNGNYEMVDAASPYRMNEFLYYITDKGDTYGKTSGYNVKSLSQVNSAGVTVSSGAVLGEMVSQGSCYGTSGLRRNVILYDSIPRIDFVNVVNKVDAPAMNSQDEEGFFTFPLNVGNFMLRHEMPTGDVRPYVDSNINNPNNEQFFTSSTDFYTVNRWIDASNQSNYGITLSPVNAPLVQYGERRSFLFSTTYNTAKPWIYSYVFNNKWNTNFQNTQPSTVTLKYSLQSHTGADWKAGRADKFGWESSIGLIPKLISGVQAGGGYNGAKGQWINVSSDHVVLTAAKLAEANGEGTILRFNETKGQDTSVTVDLTYFNPTSVMETNIIEDDLGPMTLNGGQVTFTIKGYGWKTLRLKYGSAPAQVTGVSAVMDSGGALVSWTNLSDSKLSSYEVFRNTSSGFTPGTGNYLGTVTANSFYDKQVKTGLSNIYYYKVRAVRGGLKGTPSAATQAASGANTDTTAPAAPANLKLDFSYISRVSVSWEPATDNLYVQGYRVYRDGIQIADLDATLISFLDITVSPGMTYNYTVKAYDQANNLSVASNTAMATTTAGPTVPGNIVPQATITASTEYGPGYTISNVADSIIGADNGEWASQSELNPWIRFSWPSSQTINKIVLYDRSNLTDNANGGTLSFSDGSTINVTGIPADGTAKIIAFAAKNVTWAKFQVSGGAGINVGFSEIQIFVSNYPQPAGPNIASQSTASASSQYSSLYAASKVTDGIVGVWDTGEWASNGEQNPWIQLIWSTSQTINQIILYDRNNPTDNANGGTLSFSDGSTIDVAGIPSDGSAKSVTFSNKAVTWVKFQVSGGRGLNVGLSEMQVFSAAGGTTLFSTGFETGDTQTTWPDTIDFSNNVSGYMSGINPECSIRTGETFHAGSAALMYSGTDNSATSSYCYYKVFDVDIPVTSTTKLSYWFYPQQNNGRFVAVDFICTDGTTLRDSGAVDQNGVRMHPNAGRGTINTWNYVQCNVGQWLNGKTIDRILVAYDQPGSTGQYRGYIDDLLITN